MIISNEMPTPRTEDVCDRATKYFEECVAANKPIPELVAEVLRYVLSHTEGLEREASALQDRLDLMRDEFQRINALVEKDSEIAGLCSRAISNIRQHVPVIEQRDNAENAYQTVKAWAHRLEDKIAMITDHCQVAAMEEPPGSFVDNLIGLMMDFDLGKRPAILLNPADVKLMVETLEEERRIIILAGRENVEERAMTRLNKALSTPTAKQFQPTTPNAQ